MIRMTHITGLNGRPADLIIIRSYISRLPHAPYHIIELAYVIVIYRYITFFPGKRTLTKNNDPLDHHINVTKSLINNLCSMLYSILYN